MSNIDPHTVFVSQLRSTRMLDLDMIEQVFDVVNCPGMSVICRSQRLQNGDLKALSQVYEIATGIQFDTVEDAILGWDDMRQEIAGLDALACALRLLMGPLIKPRWETLTPGDRAPWLTKARHIRNLLLNLGFDIKPAKGRLQ